MKDILIDVRLPSSPIQVIMRCISTSTTHFTLEWGHTIFLLAFSWYSIGGRFIPVSFCFRYGMFGASNRASSWRGKLGANQTTRQGPSISHLFFTDDFILFCKAEVHQLKMISNILDKFCAYSEHKVSPSKPHLFL